MPNRQGTREGKGREGKPVQIAGVRLYCVLILKSRSVKPRQFLLFYELDVATSFDLKKVIFRLFMNHITIGTLSGSAKMFTFNNTLSIEIDVSTAHCQHLWDPKFVHCYLMYLYYCDS